ncbi:hypothetical protein WQ57_15000 [Mesobacillus campisalis]|uniref:Uncharacterized protein n=1 Tax=Mesobacillus campisalis TaxID=1408103 RepID=A0A0M2SU78_9BACI|nr:hypothetical protein [Mesobacillus campisalis]KKK37261.1 hypothetical protein WQ57_15000 [Mesobacillus campisalis]
MLKTYSLAIVGLLVAGLIYWAYPNPVVTSTTSSFSITKKWSEEDAFWISGHDPQAREMRSLTMKTSKEMWETLQEGETYILSYTIKEEKVELEEIVEEEG